MRRLGHRASQGRTYEQIVEKGFRKAHHCLIRDGNPSGRLGGDKTRVMRRYALYRFKGAEANDDEIS